MYAKNTAFPSLPSPFSLTELARMCDDLNAKHKADPVTNPASCLGFHSGPWVSIFGPGMNEEGPHLTAPWKGDMGNPGTRHLTGTKPNHQYLCYINQHWDAGKPSFFPDSIPSPMAYYFMNEGSGWDLGDSVSGNAKAGTIIYVDDHQEHPDGSKIAHTGPNWMADEYFGSSIACGKISDDVIQKDTLSLEDLDYGSGGSWAWSVWFRHEKGVNYPGYQREQFFGHGDPIFTTGSRNQVHIQFEKSGALRTILTDDSDIDRFQYPCMPQHCPADLYENPHCYDSFPNGTRNQQAYDCWRNSGYKESHSTDTDPVIRDYDNGLWHHLVLTTLPEGGKGYHMYVDGVLRAASPYAAGIGVDKGYSDPSFLNYKGVGGDPIDPKSTIRFCGRAKPAVWSDEEADKLLAQFDHRRYFRGKVAHFSVWNSALSQAQVNDLHKVYVDKYDMTVTPFKMPAKIPKPIAYYYMDEGYGFDLHEAVSADPKAGSVKYVKDHQVAQEYKQPNWVKDDHFGRTIACGRIDNKTHPELGSQQKDFIHLSDIDYGSSGRWAMSVWYRHEVDMNFPGYQREQFFGHGDPLFPTNARNQVHIQFEKDDGILGIVTDNTDADRYHLDCMKDFCKDDAYIKENPSCFKWFPDGSDNPAASSCWRETSHSASFETLPLSHTDNHNWHNLVLTTNSAGKGLNMYIDGKLEARSPYCTSALDSSCLGLNKKTDLPLGYSDPSNLNHLGVGGGPIDPEGPMRLCGRQKGGAVWHASHEIPEDIATFDPKRYFRGQVAHFALWNSALSQAQVKAMISEYAFLYDLPHPAPPPDWTFNDGYRRVWSGHGKKPTVVCHVDMCNSLWSMGVRQDQMIGYFGGTPDQGVLCHAEFCMSAHFEYMKSVNADGGTSRYDIDMEVLEGLNPDIIVDVAYCYNDPDCYKDGDVYKGLLGYSKQIADIRDGSWELINMRVSQRGYIEVVDSVQNLAIAMGDPPNPDAVDHCHKFRKAMDEMKATAKRLSDEGIRVTTISLTATMIYAAQPTDDSILLMLEELGVPMTHINVNDRRGGYWEYITHNKSATPNTLLWDKSGPIYPTDIWLYDARSHSSIVEAFSLSPKEQFDHPAWVAGQIAPWPIDSTWTYEHGTHILNELLAVFNKAKRMEPKGKCTEVDISHRARLTPGQFACYYPKPKFPSCPAAGSANPTPDWMVKATQEGWIPCGSATAAARMRKLVALERRGADKNVVKEARRQLHDDDEEDYDQPQKILAEDLNDDDDFN